jgi:hypothetical protein
MASQARGRPGLFSALVIGFGAQIAGRLVDLRWHLTHDEFEGGVEQLQAHWLIWLATLFVIGVAGVALGHADHQSERRGYLIVLVSNVAYAVVAVIHFFQHLNQLEVDWAHLLLAIIGVASVIGVLWVIGARLRSRRAQAGAAA